MAGGKSPWFLDSWNSKDTKNDSSLDYEDAKDLPIELRRLEDFDDIPEPLSSAGLKSRSLGSILSNPPPKQIVRSRSSVPSLGMEIKQSQANNESSSAPNTSTIGTPLSDKRRPKLIKQKQSITDDPDFLFDGPGNPYKNTPSTHNDLRAQLLRKQSSLNEELMAESRIREKERIRKKIQKQMSLNETFLCRSVFTKRLQVIREGFTTKIKTSTGSLERVTKSGIVKIIANIKSASHSSQSTENGQVNTNNSSARNGPISRRLSSNSGSLERNSSLNEIERIRRNSRESGSGDELEQICDDCNDTKKIFCISSSDSSKDSSLQSDTSIESEDSFASVIFIPKKSENSSASQTNMPSVPIPSSPLIMMPCPTPINSPAPNQFQQQHLLRQTKEATRFNFDEPQSVVATTNTTRLTTTLRMSGSEMKPRISTIITPPSPAAFNSQDSFSPIPTKTSKHLQPRITRQTIQNLPPIPKFKKSFPIVRRNNPSSKSTVIVPKLASLEIFNPETDDLDSDLDSSEPSSPDSIDSVINALQPPSTNSPTEPLLNEISSTPSQETISSSGKVASPESLSKIKDSNNSSFDGGDKAMVINQSDSNLNVKLSSVGSNKRHDAVDNTSINLDNCREQLVEFAEKLSAQLLKELDESEEQQSEGAKDDPYLKKLNGEIRNLNQLKDELRERRLMLANLGSSDSLKSDKSGTQPASIQELEEDDSPPLSAKIQSHLSQNPNLINIGTPQTTKKHQKINDFILEENEENDEDEDSSARSRISYGNLNFNSTNNNHHGSTNDTTLLLQEDSFDEVESASLPGLQQMKQNLLKNFRQSVRLSDSNNNSNNNSCESWANSNSNSASLDSPSVGGGSATHHRYYHVFREGELDALINKHVSNLHIISSYYERASWCVVCEKVQVWTI